MVRSHGGCRNDAQRLSAYHALIPFPQLQVITPCIGTAATPTAAKKTTVPLQLPMIFLHAHQALYDQFPMKRQLLFCDFYQ